jgi:hypothetical protein
MVRAAILSGSVPQRGNECDPTTPMHVLRRAKRANAEYLGDIISLEQLRSPASLIPRFGKAANKRLSSTNSRALAEEFNVGTRRFFLRFTVVLLRNTCYLQSSCLQPLLGRKRVTVCIKLLPLKPSKFCADGSRHCFPLPVISSRFNLFIPRRRTQWPRRGRG